MSSTPLSPVNQRVRPIPSSPRGSHLATVKQNDQLCTDHYKLVLTLSHFAPSVPGQFVQLDCRDGLAESPATGEKQDLTPRSFEWLPDSSPRIRPSDPDFIAPLAYLRRPFSIGGRRDLPDGRCEIDIIHRVVGRGTHLLKLLQPGAPISLLGPLGVGFTVPADHDMACLVGGGVGIPPMFYLAQELARRGQRNAVAFIGAQRADLLPITFTAPTGAAESSAFGEPASNVADFSRFGFHSVITTDDGSCGMKGFITQALRQFLETSRQQPQGLARTVIYCCGPTPMMKATARVAADFAVPCQLSLEQPMACGMGTCQSCIIRYRPHNPDSSAPLSPGPTSEADWKYKLTCTDGPVFDSRDIVW